MPRVLCDERIPAHVKGKVHKDIAERGRKASLRWFAHVKSPRLCRTTNAGDGNACEKKKMNIKTEIDGLCRLRRESHRGHRI